MTHYSIYFYSILLSGVLLMGCQQAPDDPRAYPIQFQVIREIPEGVTNLQFIDWNHTHRQQVLTGYFGLNEEAPRLRVENLNGNLVDGRLSRRGFLLRNRRFFARDTIRFRWIETYLDAKGDGKYYGFLQKSTPTSESLLEFNPDSGGTDENKQGAVRELLHLTRPDSLSTDIMWNVTINGPYPLKHSPGLPIAWLTLDHGASIPGTIIFLDSIEPWKERFRLQGGSGLKFQGIAAQNREETPEYILVCNAVGNPVECNGLRCDVSYVAAIDDKGTILWKTEIGRGRDNVRCVLVSNPVSHLYAVEAQEVSNDTSRTKLVELDLRTGLIIRQAMFEGHVGIPEPVSGDTTCFALWVNDLTNSVQWLDNQFRPVGTGIEIDGITQFQNQITNYDKSFPPLFEMSTNREGIFLFLTKKLEPVALTRFRIELDGYKSDFPVTANPVPPCLGILHGKVREFYQANEQGKYHIVYAETNLYWWLWRYRWWATIIGGIIFGYLGLFYSFKFYRKRREHLLAEQQIRQLTHELLNAEEQERRRIGRDLHDGVAQELSAIKLNLESIRDSNRQIVQTGNEFNRILSQLYKAINEVRYISHTLLPAGLDTFGLLVSIKSLIDDFTTESGIPVEFVTSGFDDFTPGSDLSVTVYRLTQEALNNVHRHAQAKQVRINLGYSGDRLQLLIEDDGVGFDVFSRRKEAIAEKHLGLFGMTERVHQSNGTFAITSKRGLGTQIEITLPVQDNK